MGLLYFYPHLLPKLPSVVRKIAHIECLRYINEKYIGLSPLPVTVPTRFSLLVGDPYKPSFATVTGRGDNPRNTQFLLSTLFYFFS